MHQLFRFPDPVNEVSARIVAAGVVVLAVLNLVALSVLVAMIVVAATLESVFGFCLGCRLFAVLMRIGIIPESVCVRCNDLWAGASR